MQGDLICRGVCVCVCVGGGWQLYTVGEILTLEAAVSQQIVSGKCVVKHTKYNKYTVSTRVMFNLKNVLNYKCRLLLSVIYVLGGM